MEIVRLPLAELEQNIGQIPDLPMNPREWTQTDIDSLARSIKETPELFEARPCLVVPYGGKYVILAGNLRYDAARQNGETEVPAIIFPAETPIEKMKEIVIKDNGSWGKWSMDALANEWYDLPLGEWGAPEWKKPEGETDINKLFDPNKEAPKKNKPIEVIVLIPDDMAESEQAVRDTIAAALEVFPGVTVKE